MSLKQTEFSTLAEMRYLKPHRGVAHKTRTCPGVDSTDFRLD